MNIAIPTLMTMLMMVVMMMVMVVLVTLHSWSSYLCQELVSLALRMDLCNIISHQHPVIVTIVDITHYMYVLIIHGNQNSKIKNQRICCTCIRLSNRLLLVWNGNSSTFTIGILNRFLHTNFKLI